MNYYNEWDKGAAAWLRELIKAGHIPPGIVDERSITEVTPKDLAGFTQCHFFCGIGGWPLALHMAGYGADRPLWTGSPPCQPFSVAGKQLGQLDERHLAPAFMRLVDQCRPPVLFGEQVAAAIGKHWLDDLFTELERQGYACGAAVLPAASVGAPHKRDRLFFGASLGNAPHFSKHRSRHAGKGGRDEYPDDGGAGSMADIDHHRQQSSCRRRGGGGTPSTRDDAGRCQQVNGVANTCSQRRQQDARGSFEDEAAHGRAGRERSESYSDNLTAGNVKVHSTNSDHGFWSAADWLGCRDGKFRPVEPGTFPLVNGLSENLAIMRTIETNFMREVNKYAYENKKRPGQILSELRQNLQQEASGQRQPTGMLLQLHETEILLSFLRCICATREASGVGSRLTKKNDENCRAFLRSMRLHGEFSDPSCRRECTEPGSNEPANFVLTLSLLLARYATSYQQAALNAHASSGRVAMLRGYGNAIVPAVAAEFVKAFTLAVGDLSDA